MYGHTKNPVHSLQPKFVTWSLSRTTGTRSWVCSFIQCWPLFVNMRLWLYKAYKDPKSPTVVCITRVVSGFPSLNPKSNFKCHSHTLMLFECTYLCIVHPRSIKCVDTGSVCCTPNTGFLYALNKETIPMSPLTPCLLANSTVICDWN